MSSRKLQSILVEGDKNPIKNKQTIISHLYLNPYLKYSLCSFIFLSIWVLLLFFLSSSTLTQQLRRPDVRDSSACNRNFSVYVYQLPAKFNLGLLQDCRHLNMHIDMCPYVANQGLGLPLVHMGSSWFATNQFTAEMIFHARVENHPCRTWDPAQATLFYVPFYGGFHASSKFRERDTSVRDRLAVELAEYLSQQHWWKPHHGGDHFLALGRTAWDFMRADNSGPDVAANRLLHLPPVKNMSVMAIERNPWRSNQHGIPYPSYFHPSTSDEMLTWQNKMRLHRRPYLFSFVGAPRTGNKKAAIRDEIIRQCNESTQCLLLKCGKWGSRCNNSSEVVRVMTQSQFCTQAPGDSFTRRSTFDSVLAGCIPVFFSPHTAYTQYTWFFPVVPTEYSVYLPEESGGRIEEELLKIPMDRVHRMRSTVIGLIPRITYVHPNATNIGFEDAVDVALAKLSEQIQSKLQVV